VRIAIGDPAQQVALTSLMQYQYFKMPMFEGEKEDLKAKRGSNSQPDEWEEAATVSDSPEPTQVAQICANQYDTLLLSSQDAHLHKVFEALVRSSSSCINCPLTTDAVHSCHCTLRSVVIPTKRHRILLGLEGSYR
jgi:hypothetical protein